jgi:hypothetical protein
MGVGGISHDPVPATTHSAPITPFLFVAHRSVARRTLRGLRFHIRRPWKAPTDLSDRQSKFPCIVQASHLNK